MHIEGRMVIGELNPVYRGDTMADITLMPLTLDDREQFILDNQEVFNCGALEEFGRQDDHFEEEGEIISRETIERAIDGGEVYRIMLGGRKVGGMVIAVDGKRGGLDLLSVSPHLHSGGIGYAAWCAVERRHPQVTVGRPSRPLSRDEISISTSTGAASISWSFTTAIISIPTPRIRRKRWTGSFRTGGFVLRRGCKKTHRYHYGRGSHENRDRKRFSPVF